MADRPLTTGEGNTALGDRIARVINLGWPLAYREGVRDEALAALDELLAERDALREQLDAARQALDECPPGSEWWYDGRDIFHRPAGTNMQQLVIPLPETWHESQRVPDSVARFVVEAANVVIRARAALGVEGPAE